MPANSPEYLVLRHRAAHQIAVYPGAFIERGLAELQPRRVNQVKLGTTLVRSLLSHRMMAPSTGSDAGVAASILLNCTPLEVEQLEQLLTEVGSLTLLPQALPMFLQQLQAPGRRLLAVLGEADTSGSGDAHLPLARALTAHDPLIEARIAQTLHTLLRDNKLPEHYAARTELDRLVVEERPGKASLLNVGEPSRKVLMKKWQALATRSAADQPRAPVEVPAGWGVGAMLLDDDPSTAAVPLAGVPAKFTGATRLQVASLDLLLRPPTLTLDTAKVLRQAANDLTRESCGIELAGLRYISLSVPWLATMATVAAAFAEEGPRVATILYPDLASGWQPLLSCMQLLKLSAAAPMHSLPALWICTARFPEVHMVVLWT